MKTKVKKISKKEKKMQSNTKKIKKSQVKANDSEEIDSDFLEEAEQNRPEISDKSDSEVEELEDEKRMRLAKQILQETRQEIVAKQKNDNSDFHAIHMNDEDKLINQALLEKLSQRHTLFIPAADKFNREYKQEIYKGHLRAITQTQFDQFGKTFYSCSKDSSIIKWDLETKNKQFLQRELGKHGNGHHDEILTMSLNYDGKILATAGKDHSIKLWDTNSMKLIDTMKHHKSPVYGVKFGINSNNLASISCDRTLVLWDAGQRAYLDTFFGHRTEANDIDCFNSDDFITAGYDRQMIIWKTKFGSQLLFSGHDYSIDCIRAMTTETFISGSIDGNIQLWNIKKRKPLNCINGPHNNKWITALATEYNSDFAISGSHNNKLNLYKIGNKNIEQLTQLDSNGIINSISVCQNYIMTVESQEHRLGRWITDTKAKNQIVLYL